MRILLGVAALFVSAYTHAAVINSGSFNAVTGKVELSVSYGGGCSKHFFELELASGCRESFPVQCDLNLVHTTDKPDFCEAYLHQDLELDLPAGMLSDSYFERAFIKVKGAGGSEVNFQLPR